MSEQLDLFEPRRDCPVCEGRTGDPMWVFESLCEAHFKLVPRPTDEEILEALEKGRREAEASLRAYRSSLSRIVSDPTLYR